MSTQKTFTGVSLHGLPVRIEMDWPFHKSEGGSDWHVVHGRVHLTDGGALHADVALNVSQTIREALPSLDGDLAFSVSINTARKALDDKQLQLLKSGKRQPVSVSSRSYSIRRQHFTFWAATPEQVKDFVARKIFWGAGDLVLIGDPCDAQYLGAADPQMAEKLISCAKELAAEGLAECSGDSARATQAMLARAAAFNAVKDQAVEELHMKHAFERA